MIGDIVCNEVEMMVAAALGLYIYDFRGGHSRRSLARHGKWGLGFLRIFVRRLLVGTS